MKLIMKKSILIQNIRKNNIINNNNQINDNLTKIIIYLIIPQEIESLIIFINIKQIIIILIF